MAFLQSIFYQTVIGDLKLVMGSFEDDGTGTGGTIKTGLGIVYSFIPIPKGGSALADQVTVNETLPISSGDIRLVFTAGADGHWIAIGR